jgi:hypothetical protein
VESITVVTFHFGDLFWVTHLVSQLHRYPDSRIAEIWIVDQSRNSAEDLRGLPGVTRVLEFPPDAAQLDRLGHDHPSSLNHALRESFTTSHVLVLDSDCFPIQARWLEGIPPVCLAGDPRSDGLTHPCFNLLPTEAAHQIDHQHGMEAVGLDTGRLIGLQLAELGWSPTIMKAAQTTFGGVRGSLYRDGTIYHHGSASFVRSPARRLRRQVHAATEAVMRRSIAEGRFQLRPSDRLEISLRSRLEAIRVLGSVGTGKAV